MGDPESSSEKHLGQRIIDQNFGPPGGLILDPYPYYMSIYQYYYIKMLNTFLKKYDFFYIYIYVFICIYMYIYIIIYMYIYMIIYVCAGKWYIIFIWPINPIQSIAISTPIKSNPWITEWMNQSINQSPNQSFTHSILTQLVMLLIPAKDWKVTPGWKSHSPIVTVYYWDDYPPIHSPGANENPDTTVPMVVKSLS